MNVQTEHYVDILLLLHVSHATFFPQTETPFNALQQNPQDSPVFLCTGIATMGCGMSKYSYVQSDQINRSGCILQWYCNSVPVCNLDPCIIRLSPDSCVCVCLSVFNLLVVWQSSSLCCPLWPHYPPSSSCVLPCAEDCLSLCRRKTHQKKSYCYYGTFLQQNTKVHCCVICMLFFNKQPFPI